MNILPVFIPFSGCHNRCIYCNQRLITGIEAEDIITSAREQLVRWKSSNSKWDEVAFYGGNFGKLPQATRKELYRLADGMPIRYSTCPDSFSAELEQEITAYNVTTIEFGVQSLVDSVLTANGRGYTHADVQQLFDRLQGRVKLCAQMMTGLYTETNEDILASAARLGALKADYVRIYPLLVLPNTALASMFADGLYTPPPPHELILRAAWLYIAAVASGARVIRVGLPQEAADSAIAGFSHPAMGDILRTVILNAYISRYGAAVDTTGYKAVLKKRHGLDFRLQASNSVDTMPHVVARLKEAYGEGEQWFAEGENIEFAKLISRPPYSR